MPSPAETGIGKRHIRWSLHKCVRLYPSEHSRGLPKSLLLSKVLTTLIVQAVASPIEKFANHAAGESVWCQTKEQLNVRHRLQTHVMLYDRAQRTPRKEWMLRLHTVYSLQGDGINGDDSIMRAIGAMAQHQKADDAERSTSARNLAETIVTYAESAGKPKAVMLDSAAQMLAFHMKVHPQACKLCLPR